MVTFKQLEALFWIAQLGSFEAAAIKLHMSQSAISKRIAELEETFDVAMFDRARRTSQLTPKGTQLLAHASDLLMRRDLMLGEVSDKSALVGRFRIGVTELTAMTWLPALVERINAVYPRLQLEPSVEVGSVLSRRLEQDQLDLIVAPAVYADARFAKQELHGVRNALMCSPRLLNTDRVWSLAQLSTQRLLTQGAVSGSGLHYQRWFASQGVSFERTINVSNLMAQIGLTISGLGIAYLPRDCLAHLLENGDLCELRCEPSLPDAPYITLYRGDRGIGVCADIARMTAELQNFSKLLMAGQC